MAPLPAAAELSRTVELDGLSTWLDGDASLATITSDATLALPPQAQEIWQDPAAHVSAAAADGEDLLVALREEGRILRLSPDGAHVAVAKLEVGGITGLLVLDGHLFVASVAPTRVWRIPLRPGHRNAPEPGVGAHPHPKPIFSPEAAFIWALAAGPHGRLLVALGEPGGVAEIEQDGQAHQVASVPQAHVRSLAFHPQRGLFAGGGERGILYHGPLAEGALQAGPLRALFDSGLAEIVALAVDDQATYLAAMTGAAAQAATSGEGGGAGSGPEVRAQVVRVDDASDTSLLAASADEVVQDLAWDDAGRLLVATGTVGSVAPCGRLYAICPAARSLAMWLQSPSQRFTHLVEGPRRSLWAVAAGGGRVSRLAGQMARSGSFVTAPWDAGLQAQVGAVSALGLWPTGTSARLSLRTGQTARPDSSWSDWSPPQPAAAPHIPRGLPRGRFVQAKVLMSGDGRRSPDVRQLRLAMRRQNVAPFIREVAVLRRGVGLFPLPQEDARGRVVVLSERGSGGDDGREELRRGPSGPPRARQAPERGAQALRWAAEDINGDALTFSLLVRRLEDTDWTTVARELEEPFYTFSSGSLADGHYVFRVQACDAPANPPDEVLCTHRDSRVVSVDGTPPTLTKLRVEVVGRRATLRARIFDALSPLGEITCALDHGRPWPVIPQDGVLDGPEEDIAVRMEGLSPGSHVATLRARDVSDNEAVADIRFVVGGGHLGGHP